VRGSSGRVRASRRRCGGLAASLIALAACGDDITPRLSPARFVYDDGTEQIDRHQLFDRSLDTLCTPIEFSDGHKYCTPPTDPASYVDASCTRVVGRVAKGSQPVGYFATKYLGEGGDGDDRTSRVFRAGAAAERPTQRWEKYNFGCVAHPLDEAFDYYEVIEEIELGQVKLEPWFRTAELVVDAWQAPALRVPTLIENCDVIEKPNAVETTCVPTRREEIRFYADPACTKPAVLGVPLEPWITYEHDPSTDCVTFWDVASSAELAVVYDRVGSLCLEEPFEMPVPMGLLEPVDGPAIARTPTGTSRLQLVRLATLPLHDDLVHDTHLGADCRRLADGRCVPATTAKVESWFADPGCGIPIDVAMIRTGGCNVPMPYAERESAFYPVKESYAAQLYQLSTGDTCQIYNPPAPFVAHSIGPALGEDAFARATLTIE
jgi:hypothetical protein